MPQSKFNTLTYNQGVREWLHIVHVKAVLNANNDEA